MKIQRTLLVLVPLGCALFYFVHGAGSPVQAASAGDSDAAVKAITSAYNLVEQNFADPVKSEQVFYEGVIPGMLRSLDPHSNFVPPAEWKEMTRRVRAQYFGVGMEIISDGDRGVTVMRPFTNSPAANADLRRGDLIVAVDGKDTTKMNSSDVRDLLRGPRNTQVHVTVRREGGTEPYTATVTRGEIQTSVVESFWLKPGIAYLGVASFESSNIESDIRAQMAHLDESKVNALVLDLRENRGGLVNEAVALAGRFLHDNQVVVSQHGRVEQEQVYRAKGVAAAQKYPIVVVVNRNSASASEIVSGALQDHDRAWILGETTFGKGLVQEQIPVGDGGLLLTIAHYFTPSGRLIQRDYSHSTLYDYYTERPKGDTPTATADVKATDGGRKVYGGGGITPDENYKTPRVNSFQYRLQQFRGDGRPPDTFYHFADLYFGAKKPQLPANWQPDADTLQRFKEFLTSKQISFTDAEFTANRDWIVQQLSWELFFRAFDKTMADQVAEQRDPEVQQAIDSMPKASALIKDAAKVLAMRVPQ